jgi:hypothetical protein
MLAMRIILCNGNDGERIAFPDARPRVGVAVFEPI